MANQYQRSGNILVSSGSEGTLIGFSILARWILLKIRWQNRNIYI
jgi:hypothetical protein